jgi:hypothetical protein
MGLIFVSVITTRRSTGTRVQRFHKLKYGYEGPSKQLEWFACKLSEGFSSDWTFNIMQITEFEYEAFIRKQQEAEALNEPA